MTTFRQQPRNALSRGTRISAFAVLISGIVLGGGLASSQTHPEPTITFLAKGYHLGSFNKKSSPMWEFVTAGETAANWTTLVTIIDRQDAHTRQELDRLSEGVMSHYKSHEGQILLAKTMVDRSGTPFNYMVAAFDQPAKRLYELDFVKVALGPQGAYTIIYGVRIQDPTDYVGKAKAFLNQRSSQIGKEMENLRLPEMSAMPAREF